MTQASDRGADVLESLLSRFGGTAATLVLGASTLALTDCWKGQEFRDAGDGLDKDRCVWTFRSSDLAGLVPAPGMTITSGTDVWTVPNEASALHQCFFGSGWSVTAQRRAQRGEQ
mgnify:CR=1 FL=1